MLFYCILRKNAISSFHSLPSISCSKCKSTESTKMYLYNVHPGSWALMNRECATTSTFVCCINANCNTIHLSSKYCFRYVAFKRTPLVKDRLSWWEESFSVPRENYENILKIFLGLVNSEEKVKKYLKRDNRFQGEMINPLALRRLSMNYFGPDRRMTLCI